jgi:hypothetical protein
VLYGVVMLAAACAKSASKVSGGLSSGPTSRGSSGPSTAPTPASPGTSPVPAAARIPDRVLRMDAPALNGKWSGRWKSSDGSAGPFDLDVAIDAASRNARLVGALGPNFFGRGAASVQETINADLNDYAYMKPPYVGTSQIFGRWVLTGLGYGFVQLDTTNIPNHPEIAKFHTKGFVFGPEVLPNGSLPFAYKLTRTDGTVVTGRIILRNS